MRFYIRVIKAYVKIFPNKSQGKMKKILDRSPGTAHGQVTHFIRWKKVGTLRSTHLGILGQISHKTRMTLK